MVLLLAVVALTGTGWPSKKEATQRPGSGSVSQVQKLNKTTITPSSRSLVLRATHILLIRIVSSQVGPWITDQVGNPKRNAQLTIRLEEILKGTVQQSPGSEIRINIEQSRRAGTRYYVVSGVWSYQPIEPGSRLITFSSATGNRVSDLLVEPSCIRILRADEYLRDVRLAMKAEAEQLPLPILLKLAEPSVTSLNYVFAEYVTSKFDTSLLKDVDQFGVLMRFLEDPALPIVARSTLLTNIVSRVIAADPAPMPYVQALTVTMFHLVALPDALPLRDNIFEVYLPGLLGLSSGGVTKKKAVDVFRGIPEERQKAEGVLQKYRGEAAADALMRWLRE